MRVKSYKGKVYGAELTSAERKALNIEINRQISETYEQYAENVDALILYTLMKHYGWGKQRLKGFWKAFNAEHKALRVYYQMEDPEDNVWLAQRKLKDIGVDIHEWYKEDEVE